MDSNKKQLGQAQQEQIQKTLELNALDSRLKEFEQSLVLLERQITELHSCQFSLDELENIKTGNEMMAPLGSGIFVKANLAENKNVLLDVGAKTFCKKSTKEAKEVIKQKLEKALDVRNRLATEMENLAQNIMQLERQLKAK